MEYCKQLEPVAAFAAAHGYRRIELEVFANNTAAIRLYEREGFGDEAVDLLMMGRGI